jgi:voltage-gated potassium channel
MNKVVELIVAVLTIASLLVILTDFLIRLEQVQRQIIYIFDFGVVIILETDFYNRFRLSHEGLKFILKHWYAMVPLMHVTLEPHMFLRGLRLIASFRLIMLYRIYFEENEFVYIASFSAITITLGAVAIYLVESTHKHVNIKTLGDGFWWAIQTVTTVGNGDVYPVTTEGKIVASSIYRDSWSVYF